jgi:hypothetical protein
MAARMPPFSRTLKAAPTKSMKTMRTMTMSESGLTRTSAGAVSQRQAG